MNVTEFDTEALLDRVDDGDKNACDQLFERHRKQLRQMVAVRMNGKLLARTDPSDVVQETLIVAHRRLAKYLANRDIPFYPWLRDIAWNRLLDLHRHHHYKKRSVHREVRFDLLNEESAVMLAGRLGRSASTPTKRLIRDEMRRRVMDVLNKMPDDQREIIIMRHLEGMKIDDIAAVLKLSPGTVMSRHFRGLKKMRRMLNE